MKRIVLFVLISFFAVACDAQSTPYSSLDNAEFAKVIGRKNVQLVDVRTSKEFADGHLPEAQNIDVNASDFVSKTVTRLDKENPVAVYCRSGKRSKVAAQWLSAHGFEVYELNTGIRQWDGDIVK